MGAVAHIINSLHRGGAERMLVRLLTDPDADPAIHHLVITLLPGGTMADTLRSAGIEVHELGLRRGWPSLRGLCQLVRFLRAHRPDLVMTWLYHSDLIGTVARPFARSPRLIWHLQGSDAKGLTLPRRTRLIIRLLALLSRYPESVAVNSRAAVAAHEAVGYRPRRWIHLPNGFDTDHWRPDPEDRSSVRAELAVADDERMVVCVARADPEKDHTNLLGAAQIFLSQDPKSRLLLIGRGTAELAIPPGLRDQVTALGERSDVARLLRGCDIAILSSRTEGFPNVLGEAMSTGLPAVTTDVGDTRLLVEPIGIAVPPQDPEALAEAALTMLRLPADELQQRGLDARRRIIERYSLAEARAAYERSWLGAG